MLDGNTTTLWHAAAGQGQHLQFSVAAGVQFDVVEVQTIDDRLATPSLQ